MQQISGRFMALFAALALSLTAGCSGSDAPTGSDHAVTKAPSSAKGSGTFSVSGATTMSGKLTDVVCVEANKDNYIAYGHYRAAGQDVVVSAEVASAHHEGDQEEANSVNISGSKEVTYNRFSMDGEPLSTSRKGSHILGSAKLVDSRDIFHDDRSTWRYVTLTTDFNCGTQLR